VRKKRIIAGRLQQLAVQRHQHDLKHAGRRGYWFSEAHAVEAITFIETCCHHSKGQQFAGQPLRLTPCQKFIVWCLFGWRRESDGLRRFKKAYLSMARKWGKSTFAAALALLLLAFDHPIEPGAEIYAVATKEDQARIVHNEAKRMVGKSPALRRRLQVLSKSIEYPREESSFRVIGSDSDSTDGLNIHGAILDELHAWREKHRGLHEKLTTAGGARLQPLWVTITTAGDDNSNIWMEEEGYAIRCVEAPISGQVIDDEQFAFVCTIDEGDDPFDERVWVKANPHIGESVSIDYCRGQAVEAKGKPTAYNKFLRYVCNKKTASSERAIMPELWAAGGGPPVEVARREGFGAWDLGRSNDWGAVARVYPRGIQRNGKTITAYDVRVQCWTCEESPLPLQQHPFTEFIKHGSLIVCSGDSVDFNDVEEHVLQVNRESYIESWAYDPSHSKQLAQRLLNTHGINVFPFSQTHRFYNEPIRTLLQLVKDGRLLHGDDPCLAWQAGNLTIDRNQRDEWLPEKRTGAAKIDAMVALLMALSEALYHGRQGASGSAIVLL
jgi:phage terminase large subunit-like protein